MIVELVFSVFISHYVQIKLGFECDVWDDLSVFISHYVQIKQTTPSISFVFMRLFISHYVQIKPKRIRENIFVDQTLYPTTFR